MDTIIGRNPAKPPAGSPGPSTDAMIVDGTQATFMQDVIEASRHIPVLVDFWATWCGPCKQLTPALEKVTTAAAGRIKLVKIDIDANKALVQQLASLGLPMQSVPTVAAFWQGQIADVFQGALPESEIKRFVEGLLKMAGGAMPSADLLAEAKTAMEDERFEEAGALFSELLQDEPENPGRMGWSDPRADGARPGRGSDRGTVPSTGQDRRPCRDQRRPQCAGAGRRGPGCSVQVEGTASTRGRRRRRP